MKILSVLTYYHPHWTGLTAHAVGVAEGLARRGHEVTVLTSRHDAALPREELRNGVRIVRLAPLFRYSRGVFQPTFPWTAARLVRAHDVVQIHTPLPEAPLVALLARGFGRPLLMTHHGDLVMPAGIVNRAIERIGNALLGWAGQLADGVTSYSDDYAAHSRFLRPLRHKTTAIAPPVELPEPDPAAARRWRRELGLDDRLLIGFAGRWVEEKGYDLLLRALGEVRRVHPHAHLVFAGESRVVYEQFFRRCQPLLDRERGHVTLLGLLRGRQQLANFYAMLDLFVLPSRSDMMALGQVEAMCAGTPVVATDIPGARVVVRESGHGLLSPPEDPAALARTIVEALARRAELAPDSPRIRERYAPERATHANEELLTRLVSERDERRRRRIGVIDRVEVAVGTLEREWNWLRPEDHLRLERLLGNEADLAYRRRALLLLELLELEDGDRVLDAGCGMGFYVAALRQLRDLRVVGVDRAFERLASARSRLGARGLAHGDAARLPFADASFDAVLLSEVLEHLGDERAALAELRRVLRPGGTLAISVPHADYPWAWDPIGRLREAIGARPLRSGPLVGIWTGHERLYTPGRLRRALERAGFAVERLEEATHFCPPFAHLLLYGVGKPLLERGLLPEAIARRADRFRADRAPAAGWNPLRAPLALLRAIDRRNDGPAGARATTFVNVVARARKPEGEP